jgi:ATPase subunit of ABC transporter with duplicated ATPase domains
MIDFSKQKVREQLFGDEDALKDDPNRLRAYYFKGEAYQQVISDEELCLLVGYKGTGKSALLRVACNEEIDTGKPAISINAYDFDSSSLPSSGSNDLASHVRDWKNGLARKLLTALFAVLKFEEKPLWISIRVLRRKDIPMKISVII